MRTVGREGRTRRWKNIHDVKVDGVLLLDIELLVGNVADELFVECVLNEFVELLVAELLLLKASTRNCSSMSSMSMNCLKVALVDELIVDELF